MSRAAYLPFLLPPCGDRSGLRSCLLSQALFATTPAADVCRPVWTNCSTLSPVSRTNGRSPEVNLDRLSRATAEFTLSALDGYGLRGSLPARPALYASDPVLVHRLTRLLHASFTPRLAATHLRFAMTSPPSGCQGDFHPRAVEYARYTTTTGSKPVESATTESRGGRLKPSEGCSG
jgi:hypothetical protein